MHCTNCGAYIPPGARFCAGCGAPAADPEVTRYAPGRGAQQPPSAPPQQGYQPESYAPQAAIPSPAYNPVRQQANDQVERQIFKTRPTLLFIKIGYGLAALGAILVVILLAYYIGAPWWVALPIALALLLIPAYYHIKRNMVQYTLTSTKLEIDEGFISRTTRNFPLRNIQDVTVSTTVMQRLLGYGNVVIEDAGKEAGGATIMHNIHNPRQYADMLLREMGRFR
jgi:membrane protein YdbS with pleckstrin-like domain